jgi:Family of unknown function (DUF6364)
MPAKLTLRLDEALIARAKSYSKQTGKSVSRLVADYLALLPQQAGETRRATPIVRSLRGLLRGADLDEQDYRRHLEEKYR